MDERAEVRHLERQRELALGGNAAQVRRAVRSSWERARRSGLRPDRHVPPVLLPEDEVLAVRREHALARVWPTLLGTLRAAVSEPGQILFVSDASGNLLWMAGQRGTLRQAERAHLVLGASWNEESAGTNGVGTTLALGQAFQVYGAEHYMSVATPFVCSGAPVRDPVTDSLLGVVDLTNGLSASRSLSLAAVTSAACAAENLLRGLAEREHARLRDLYLDRVIRRTGATSAIVSPDGHVIEAHPPGWLPRRLPGPMTEGHTVLPGGLPVIAERLTPGGPFLVFAEPAAGLGDHDVLGFSGLGVDHAWLRVHGVSCELSRRHSELMAVLLATPSGLTAEQLAREVYGPRGKAVTVRAELARLRRVVGYRLAAEPYRLTGRTQADFIDLDRNLAAAGVTELLDRYRGPLLPGSASPRVVELRRRLHERLRGRVLSSRDADAMTRWVTSGHGRGDQEIARAINPR